MRRIESDEYTSVGRRFTDWFRNLKQNLRARSCDLPAAVRPLYVALGLSLKAVAIAVVGKDCTRALRLACYWWRETRYRFTRTSIFSSKDEISMCSLVPQHALKTVLDQYRPTSVLDVGCGTGRTLDLFLKYGIDAIGLEGSATAIKHAQNPDKIMQVNLNKPVRLGRKFDLVWSFEVVEHIHSAFTNILLNTLTDHADRIVISAAKPGQQGAGHLNEQTPEYWISHLRALGYQLNISLTRLLQSSPDEHAENFLAFDRDAQNSKP